MTTCSKRPCLSSRRRSCLLNRNGAAIVEFAGFLPFLVITMLGLADLGILLQKKVTLIHISREAAGAFSRGSSYTETFNAVVTADGDLDLDGPNGKIILSEIKLDDEGNPVLIRQQMRGNLVVEPLVGTLPPGSPEAPAIVPNGQLLPANMTLYVVEVYSQRSLVIGLGWSDRATTVLSSLAAF